MKTLKQYLDKNNIPHEIGADGSLTVGGSFYLGGMNINQLPDNLAVGGFLDIRGTNITQLPDNLTVGGFLDIRGTNINQLPDDLTVGGSLDLEGTNITQLPDNLTVGGFLDLRNTNITQLPDNLTVGGFLDIRGTNITQLPDNLAVGGYLDLGGTNITQLPDNLAVDGYLDLRNTNITQPKKHNKLPDDFQAKISLSIELKFSVKGFTIADGILARVIQSKANLKKIIIVGKKKPSWLALDNKGNYAHGETARQATLELAFKVGDRNIEEFRNMSLDTKKTPQEWAFAYRMVTGACRSGTEHFMASKKLKKTYTLAEILEETSGAYGFEQFAKVVKEAA